MSPNPLRRPRGWLSDARAVVEPRLWARPLTARDALICFSSHIFQRLEESLDLQHASTEVRLPAAVQSRVSECFALVDCYFGAPAAGMLLETLIASGVERVWMVAQAGAVSRRCRIGDLFIPTWGLREEGTSYHYLPPYARPQPSEECLELLRHMLRDRPAEEGGIWSIDAPFRETEDKVRRYSRRGVRAVDMECSALMAICQVRGVRFGAVMTITDELHGEHWKSGFDSAPVLASQSLMCERLAAALAPAGSSQT